MGQSSLLWGSHPFIGFHKKREKAVSSLEGCEVCFMDTHCCVVCVCLFWGQAPSFFPSVFALDLLVVSILCSVLLVIEIISKTLGKFLTRNISMEGGCELLGIKKKASIFLYSNFYDLWSILIHAFICSFLFFIQYRWDCRPCAGSKGAISGLRRIHSLVSETHTSAVAVQMGKSCPSQKCAEGATAGPEEEHLTHLGRKDVGKFLTQGRIKCTLYLFLFFNLF